MPKFKVTYSEHTICSIEIDAESAEEAKKIVDSGQADYNDAITLDTEFCGVNGVQEILE